MEYLELSYCFVVTSIDSAAFREIALPHFFLVAIAMKYSLGLLGVAALAAASDVHELTQDTFGPFVKEHDLVLAECM